MSALEILVSFAPLLAIALVLLLGRYPGERVLRRRLGRSPRPGPLPSAEPAGRRSARTQLPRGGALLAHALAGRAPPAGAVGRTPFPRRQGEQP